jgi:hypothetical protein
MYTTSVSGEEAVEPETISESSSQIAFKFRHNLEFKYARLFFSESSSPIALQL